MTNEERVKALQLLKGILDDNHGQRLTLALAQGIIVTMDVNLPRDPEPVADPTTPADPDGFAAALAEGAQP